MLVAAVTVAAAQPEPPGAARDSKWWSQVEPIDGSLRNGRWKYARRNTRRLTATVLEESWRDPELDAVLAELALYRAIAEVNLNRQEDATWYWQMAMNLDRSIAERDLAPYGKAAASLSEIPLRKPGKIPSSFLHSGPDTAGPVRPPGFPEVAPPILINNAGGATRRSADFEVEVIVDQEGNLHQPVVISRYANPVVSFACLEWLHGVPALEPARLGGRPVATTYSVMIEFKISSHSGALVLNEGDAE